MFHSIRVRRLVQETADARSIVLDVPPSLLAEFTYRAGQFVTLEVELGGERLRRCYSLASSPQCDDELKVAVKRVAGGRVSSWLNDTLREGDTLSVLRPEGRFVLDAGKAPLLLFAGGSGITPVISILKTALATTTRSAKLLYANRDASSVIFADELERLQQAHPDRLRIVHRHDDRHGFLDGQTVEKLGAQHTDAACYLCGPAPFMALVERSLAAAGVPDDQVRIERFVLADRTDVPPPSSLEAGDTPEFIEVGLGGKTHRLPYVPGRTLLQTARDAGLDAPYSCEEGFCGCCASDLLEGRVVMASDDALNADEKRRGMILACQSRPVTRRCAFRFVEG